MSTAAIDAKEALPAAGRNKKKLLVIVIVAALLLAIAGAGGLLWVMKKRAAAAAADDGAGAQTTHAEDRHAHGEPPTYVPLDPFTVNLADRDAERYAQIGMTLELDDPAFADQIQQYMPAIRNNILMVLAHKTSAELLEREGKLQLAAEVAREIVRPMGIEVASEPTGSATGASGAAGARKAPGVRNPVRRVHFSNFIVQ
jgi:flagellar FliL protein